MRQWPFFYLVGYVDGVWHTVPFLHLVRYADGVVKESYISDLFLTYLQGGTENLLLAYFLSHPNSSGGLGVWLGTQEELRRIMVSESSMGSILVAHALDHLVWDKT